MWLGLPDLPRMIVLTESLRRDFPIPLAQITAKHMYAKVYVPTRRHSYVLL